MFDSFLMGAIRVDRSPGGVNSPGLTDCGLLFLLVVISPE